ncbi:Hypothetical protein NCS54_00135200 [Fusarium falciforme]|uniref:Hypothetical protein n=1 Tax=Fusarium falciforme TaxID=195108 RepID=UPI002301CB0A|nr:Hypothetical protein NCS54_00135200 [Fusarium falciforme]WAO84146.1 Hypothetical protein NCS54_00135200 [Fusarium falciforme]
MEAALTFGSLGDIIQLCQLAIQLGRAVGVGCGAVGESSKEYQELREDLNFFVRILTQVVATYEKHESSTYLADLDQASKSVVNKTASLIQDALDHFQSRYKSSLHPGGSGKKLKDAYKKLEWSTREKERIRCLREKLQESVQRLQLLTSLAARKSARVDNAVLLDRVAEVQTLLSKTYASQEEVLHLIQQRKASDEQAQKLDELSQLLAKQDKSSLSVLAVAGDALSAILQVKDLLIQVSQDAINVDMVFNSTHLRPMDPTNGLPAIIEDALGRQVPIPAEWLGSLEWEALYALLSCHFKGQNGHEMVMRREYALEESASGRDLDPERPLHLCLRRGMRINMSMIFQTAERLSGACPRCRTETAAPEGITAQCPRSDCGMWFRMQEAATGGSNQMTSSKDLGKGATAAVNTPAQPADFQRVRLFRHDMKMKVSKVVSKSKENPGLQYSAPPPQSHAHELHTVSD